MPTFPISFRPRQDYHTGGIRFGADRAEGRKHAACDLLAPKGTPIFAVKDGEVIQNAYPFYHGTDALEVDHGDFVVRYSEIQGVAPGIAKGSKVTEGQVIAYVGKMYVDSMLHFEMYSKTIDGKPATGGLTNRANQPYQRRADLTDPTSFLDGATLKDSAAPETQMHPVQDSFGYNRGASGPRL